MSDGLAVGCQVGFVFSIIVYLDILFTPHDKRRMNDMKISDWLDKKEAEGRDVSRIVLPEKLAFAEDPDETIFYEEIRPCGIFCTENHPFATVERFGHWYYCRGQDKAAGIHSSKMRWREFTKDRDAALKIAKEHIR